MDDNDMNDFETHPVGTAKKLSELEEKYWACQWLINDLEEERHER